MKIWVDADACPVVIKDILFRAADRMQIHTTLVANQSIKTPPSRFIKSIRVSAGFDVADDEIVRMMDAGDLVITSDIPLASDAIDKGGLALSPRGELFTTENIKARLNIRDFLDTCEPVVWIPVVHHRLARQTDRSLLIIWIGY
jgi:uncharacterized protein YaiI (UPF0178 family)